MHKLFQYNKIRKFFDILSKLERSTTKIYVNPNVKSLSEPDKPIYYCAREVFVERTIGKWFKGKYLILFKNGYKKYLYITNIKYALTYGVDLNITMIDFSRLDNIEEYLSWKTYNFNDLYNLEGQWCQDSSQHNKLLELLKLNLPIQKFKFKVFNTDLLNTITDEQLKSSNPYDHITEYIEVEAMTENEANDKLKVLIKDNPHLIMSRDTC